MNNELFIKIKASLVNESFIRSSIASFISYLNPTINYIQEIKTAISEAVTNSIIHGYEQKGGYIEILVNIDDKEITISIKDFGKGIEDVKKAQEPFFTTKKEGERSGMGFTLMQTFMDEVKVFSQLDKGTEVIMKKLIFGDENAQL